MEDVGPNDRSCGGRQCHCWHIREVLPQCTQSFVVRSVNFGDELNQVVGKLLLEIPEIVAPLGNAMSFVNHKSTQKVSTVEQSQSFSQPLTCTQLLWRHIEQGDFWKSMNC
jgi:hypothetical protein